MANFVGNVEHKFVDEKIGQFYSGTIIKGVYDMFNIYINRSNQEEKIIRTVSTITTSLSSIGGFITFIFMSGRLFINPYQVKSYYNSLSKRLFKV